MDGMNWLNNAEINARTSSAIERNEVRSAAIATAASIVLAIAFVLALSAMNVHPPVAEEFSSAPVSN